ncbi:MarR family winged helix-turn-helix transcriptional regulator [Streptomyces sp. MBT53]|uniref:MarR family winged helix-turn-helix transcriptional regulator n=1 Tax=Streptomyces sp. MBT53 TaxID=1488384 RepID=UPI00191330D0|nr:MarR family transcriptional regulator [Streptomyces sp. MBT53]MBK6012287.1 MarR family transcriptional regulator [Streptomyces sp. MBT53]
MGNSEIAPTALAAQVERVLAEWRVARPDLDPTPFRLFSALAIAGRQVQEFYDASTAQHGLSGPDFFLLAELRRRGEPFQATPGELTQVLVRSSGGTTKLLDRLVAVGHITRVANPDDRRSTLVQLTDNGRRLIDVALQDHLAAEATLLQDLDPADTTLVIDLLWALTSRLRAWTRPD